MCGVLGAIGQSDKTKFLNSLSQIKHRGPDYTSYYFYKNLSSFFVF